MPQARNRAELIADLRARVDAIERPAEPPRPATPSGLPGTVPGLLNEVFTPTTRNAGASLGLALALARGLASPARPALLYLGLAHETHELGLPYAPALAAWGIDPATLTMVRAKTLAELLWAAEEALECSAVAAVVADLSGRHERLDFTASRRLGLRAEATRGAAFVLRYGDWREASAARRRWSVTPAASTETPFDNRATGRARWHVRLEKGLSATAGEAEWIVEVDTDGLVPVPLGSPGRPPAAGATLSRAVAAPLADRLARTA